MGGIFTFLCIANDVLRAYYMNVEVWGRAGIRALALGLVKVAGSKRIRIGKEENSLGQEVVEGNMEVGGK